MSAAYEPTLRRFEGAGVVLVADEAGPKGGPPVLLLHGGGQTRQAWGGAVTEGARRGYHMITLDLRGHGDSDWAPEGDYRLRTCAADIARIVQELPHPPTIVGASMGGMVALEYVGAGGPLKSLVLVDIAPRVEEKGTSRVAGFMRDSAPRGFADLDEAADTVAAYLPNRKRPRNTSGLMKNLRLREDGRLYWHWDPMILGPDMGAKPDEQSLRAAAMSLNVPALLVRGRESDVLSMAGVKDFLEICPHAEFVDIQDADHMVAGDKNDIFNGAVFDFLARHA